MITFGLLTEETKKANNMAPQIIWKFVCKITRLCSLEFCCSFIGSVQLLAKNVV